MKSRVQDKALLKRRRTPDVEWPEREATPDPRFRDPDSFLAAARERLKPIGSNDIPRKEAGTVLKGFSQYQEGGADLKIVRNNDAVDDGAPARKHHEPSRPVPTLNLDIEPGTELLRWRNYQRAVDEWKTKVLGVVARMQKQLDDAQKRTAEADHLREQLRQRDDEIARLKRNSPRGD